ncbi:hypothetical protein ACWX0K_20540 [Nitrobacteraceae bacterium UC4446_H13]
MTNPDLLPSFDDADVQIAYRILCQVDENTPPGDEHWEGFTARRIIAALRRLASSEGVVKGEPEPVAWPANLNPRTLDLVQRFALALAKKLRLAEEKYGHTDGWLRDDWEAECRDHLYQHLEKGDPRDVAAYCAFMWHHGWITYRPEPVASKRPVAFRVRQHRLSNYYELYTDEKDAQFWADDRGVDYEGLYLVADRYLAQPADAGMREALERSIRELEYNRANHYSPDITTINRLKDQVLVALTAPGATTKSDGGVERRHAVDDGGSTRTTRDAKAVREAGVATSPSDDFKEALRLLKAEDDRQSKLHDLLETIREQIRTGVEPEHRPEGLFRNIQDAVYAMRGRTPLMNDAAITCALVGPSDPSSTRSEVTCPHGMPSSRRCSDCNGY